MCGLVGMAGTLHKPEHDGMFDMLMFDLVRGPHSTGLGHVKRNGDMTAYKTTEDGYGFSTDPRAIKSVTHDHCVLIGHNRWATRGKITRQNAHPFIHEHIMGAQNGTLDNMHVLEDHALFDVDSDALFYNIAHHGIEKVIPTIRGAWALTWYDAKEHTVNFLANDQRPLCYAFSDDRKKIFWASEPWMIHGGVVRRNIKLLDGKCYIVPDDTHMRLEVPKAGEAFGEFFRQRIKGAEPYPKYQAGFWEREHALESQAERQARIQRELVAERTRAADARLEESIEARAKENGKGGTTQPANNVVVLGSHRGYKGLLLTKDKYIDLISEGCAGCGTTALFTNETPMWIGDNEWLCPVCVQGNYTNYIVEPTNKRVIN